MPGGFFPPPAVIETWPKPDYVDPVTRGYALVVCLAVFLFLALLAVAARIWARFFILRSAGLDDLLALFATIPTIGLTIAIILGMYYFSSNSGKALIITQRQKSIISIVTYGTCALNCELP